MRGYRRRAAFAAPALGVVLLAAPGAWAGSYTFQTIDNLADPTFNQLLGINNSGTIAGYFGSGQPGFPNQGYTTVPPYAAFTPENFPGSAQTQVTGLNNTGVTVGFYSETPAGTDNFGFVDNNGSFTRVTDPNTPTNTTAPVNQLLGINDHNIAVGFYNTATATTQGYTYAINSGIFTPISIAGATSDVVTGINNAGEISGFYVSAVNGDTYGFTENTNGSNLTSFEAAGSTNTMFLGVNNNGEAVGTYTGPNGNTHGLTYANGVFTAINDPFAVGAAGTTVNGVNDQGQLVGFYSDAAGNVDGFLATPVPEPPAVATFATALLLLAGVRVARRRG